MSPCEIFHMAAGRDDAQLLVIGQLVGQQQDRFALGRFFDVAGLLGAASWFAAWAAEAARHGA